MTPAEQRRCLALPPGPRRLLWIAAAFLVVVPWVAHVPWPLIPTGEACVYTLVGLGCAVWAWRERRAARTPEADRVG